NGACRSPWRGAPGARRSRHGAGHAARLSSAAGADGASRVTPGELLVGAPEQFVEANRRDMELARGRVARLKAMPSPRGLAEALGAYDDAIGALSDASSRASVARNAHPTAAMRDAAERCEQEVDALSTELSLDRGIYEALRQIGDSGAGAQTRLYLQRVLRDC